MRKVPFLATSALLAACTSAPYALRDMGSFHVGGRDVEISGKPVKEVVFTPGGVPAKIDLNGTYAVEAMYVQYFLPENRRGTVPLLMWHGGGLTGVSYESTPDGRAGWAMSPDIFKGEPVFLAKANPWERFRIGQGPGSWSTDPAQRKLMPNSQFPVEAYDNFVKQAVPRWTTTDDAILRAYIALVDRVCPCVILFHSQAGQFGFKVAQARPDKVKALVAVEPAGIGDPKQAGLLAGIPTLAVFGDNIALDSRWPQMRKNDDGFFGEITKAGGKVDVLDLPKAGLVGNSHMLMMDRNNLQVAALIQEWLAKQGLVR